MSAPKDRLELYYEAGSQPNARIHRWSYVSSNGRILADSGQGYSRRIDALNGARRVIGVPLSNEPDFVETQYGPRQVWLLPAPLRKP